MTPERPLSQLLDLSGKVAIVTGAAGWLGAAMSRALAEAGAAVAVSSRDAARAQQFAQSLPGGGHRAFALDLNDESAIPGLVEAVVSELGQVDILVNNAYGGTAPSIDTATAADFNRAYHTGVTSYFLLARAVVDHLRSRGAPGSIINIASMYGVVASYPDAYTDFGINSPPNYHGLKGGLIHLTRHLAAYWADDQVRVNAISPGPFPSPRVQESQPEFVEKLAARVPLKRMGQPEELKGLVVLLASDAGSFITGQNILVDGGWTVW